MKLVIGISGASGAPYAKRLLEVLTTAPLADGVKVSIVLSSTAEQVYGHECRGSVRDFGLPVHEGRDYGAPFASGSSPADAMVIIPASMSTVAKVAHGLSDNLLTRAADVVIKERKRLVMVPRETPYSEIHLTNLLALARMGVTILPASPSFYGLPRSIDDLLDTVVGRVCDQLGLSHALTRRWGSDAALKEKRS